jgi:hypothetical protein
MGKKLMLTAIGLGAAYLWKNKDSRQKLMNIVQSATGSLKQKMHPPTSEAAK